MYLSTSHKTPILANVATGGLVDQHNVEGISI